MTTKQLLVKTLKQLSPEEFDEFKSLSNLRSFLFSNIQLKAANIQDVAELMMEKFDQDCVEETRKVLMKMSRTDLVQRLSGISSGTKEKQLPPLIQRVEMMASFIELLLETLAGLRDRDLRDFKENLWSVSPVPRRLFETADLQDTVLLMVQTLGRQSVEMTKKVLIKMNRSDLVQRLSDSSPGPKKKQLDEHLSAVILKLATVAAVKELLLETLEDLSEQDLREFTWFLQFTCFQRSLPQFTWIKLYRLVTTELVNEMVKTSGQRSVELTREVFMDMNRTDLVQRLPETTSGTREKQSVDERWPALSLRPQQMKVETMASVIELLLETLAGLRDKELEEFKENLQCQIQLLRPYSYITWRLFETVDLQDTVFVMVQTLGRQSVETTKEILIKMKRTDLVQRLSDSSSGPEEKPSVEEQRSALIHKMAIVAAVKELLLETLEGLSDEELEKFKRFLQLISFQRNLPHSSVMFSFNRTETVDLMVMNLGQQSMELTREVLMNMERTDLVQKLPETSSEIQSVDEHGAALLNTEAEIAAVQRVLLETLDHLNQKDLKTFRWFLQLMYFQKGLRQMSWHFIKRVNTARLVNQMVDWADTTELVKVMMETCGRLSVEVTREVFMDMKRTDLVQKLPETSSGSKEKPESSLFQTEVTMAAAEEKLVETLKDLSNEEFEDLKRVLEERISKRGLPRISGSRLETADKADVVQVMVQMYSQQSVEVTVEALQEISRTDLIQRLSSISSASKGPSRRLEPEGGGSSVQDSSDWTPVEPEVNRTDADEAPTYSLQSAAGHFECSVSRLRWVCQEKTSLKYQFGCWEGHMQRMESLGYMPAGPLMDVTVTGGMLNEVHLPHWICTEDNPEILDKFATIHVTDCGDVVEKVCEVTASHVKLTELDFSLRGVLIKLGFPVKVKCNVLMYKTDKAFLTLHIYFFPRDPGLQQEMEQREKYCRYKLIRSPHPRTSVRLYDCFILAADLDCAKISPEDLELTYESSACILNFFEVYIGHPDTDFQLQLRRTNEFQPVWTCAIRKEDYQSTGQRQEKPSVDEQLSAQMQKAATITTDREKILETLEYLKQEELKKFKWFLQGSDVGAGLPGIPKGRLEKTSTCEVVDLMLQTYNQQTVEVTKEVFKKLCRNDLVQKLSETSS